MGSHRESKRVRERILDFVSRVPGARWSEIEEALGLTRNSMKAAMMRLKHDGDIRHEGNLRNYRYYPTRDDGDRIVLGTE